MRNQEESKIKSNGTSRDAISPDMLNAFHVKHQELRGEIMESDYRGEYPNRIKCVWSALRKPYEVRAGLFATTNCGAVYRVVWLPSASLPQPGEDIFTFRADTIYKPYNDLAIKLGGL